MEPTSIREAVPAFGEPGVRMGVLSAEDAWLLCGLLRMERARRDAAAKPDQGGCEE